MLEKVNNSAGELLSTCKGADPRVQAAKMREMAGLLGKTIQPHIQRLVQRLNAAEQAALTYAETRDAFHAGNIDSARQRLGIARNRLDAVDAGDCPDLRAAITKAPRVLDNWGRAADATDQAAAACNIEQMERLVSKFRGANSLTGSALVARLA